MSKPYWSGVFPAITTQLKRDQSLDLDGTARHAETLISSGVAGIIFLGSLGENQALLPAIFAASDESYFGGGGTVESWVTDLYRFVLGRPADKDGYAAWTAFVQTSIG